MTGPTSSGSIDASINLDSSSFRRSAGEVRREARELGALSPTVDVNANVGSALAGLAAVAKAERDLDVAFQRSAISQAKLNAATQKHGDDSLQAATARLSLTRATNAEHDAEARLTAVRAQSMTVTEGDTAATSANVDANNRRISGLQVLLALAPAIVAAAAPIGASAIGLGSAFGVMAAAGVFAFKGIQREMEIGTQVGAQYSAGLDTMSGYMDALKHTSAVAMLGQFNQATSTLGTYMPMLNSMVGEFSGKLGYIGNTALSGVLSGLTQMNPLIQAGAVELGNFVSWLSSFTDNNGFSSFVSYATSNLPPVMGMIRELVTLGGNILAAFAPLGPVVVGLITGMSSALNGLPLPVLAGLATSAMLLNIALRLAFSDIVSGLIGKAAIAIGLTGTMAQLAVPVVGILTAAIAGIAVASTAAALSTGQNTIAVQDYTQALIEDNNVIGEHVRMQTVKALNDSGAFEAAKKLGIAQSTLTDAALDLGGAQGVVAGKVTEAMDKMGLAKLGTEGYALAQGHLKSQGLDLMPAIDMVNSAVGSNVTSVEQSKIANENMAAAMLTAANAAGYQMTAEQTLAMQHGISATAYQSAVAAQEAAAVQLEATTAKMYMQNDAAGILKAALDGLNGKAISAAQAQNAFDAALVNMGTHVTATGKQITFTTTSINDMSSASVGLRGQLNSQVTNLQNVIAANGGLANSTGAAREQMVSMRGQIIENAVAHGVDRAAVTAYIDKLMAIPRSVPPTKLDVDNAGAIAKVNQLQAMIDGLRGRSVTNHINSVYSETHVSNGPGGSGGQTKSEGGPIYRADGGPVAQYLSNGGHSWGPQGTDTVAAYLTPGEHVMRRSSAQSIGAPALNYMNETGKLPPGGGGTTLVKVYIDGKEMRSDMVQIAVNAASNAIDGANDYAGRRPAR